MSRNDRCISSVRKLAAFTGAALVATTLLADFELKIAPQSYDDWTSRASYVEDAVPGDGDIVVLPANMTAKVDKDSIAFVSKFARIKPLHATTSILEVTIDDDDEQSLGCAVYNSERLHSEFVNTSGRIVKKGAGTLSLASSARADSYFTDIDVQEGTLALVPRLGKTDRFYGRINVSEDATLVLGADETAQTQNWMIRLTGAGIVKNGIGDAARCVLMPGAGGAETAPAEFSGRIVDRITWWAYGNQHLTGTDSTFSGGFHIKGNEGSTTRGITGVMKFGEAGQPSSAGTHGTVLLQESGGRVLYLGAGETTGKSFQLHASGGTYPSVIDAGATGGLVLTGRVFATDAAIERLVLTGSNTVESVLAGSANEYTESGKSHAIYLNKKGPGTWRLTDSVQRTGLMGVGVEEGTLVFESLTETGTVCSVGRGGKFVDDKRAANWADVEYVPYQFKLGSATTMGTLQYAGGKSFINSTRPIALAGDGALVNSGTNAAGEQVSTSYDAGVSALTAGLKKLVLSGSNTAENVIGSISDGNGTVAVEKTGFGSWTLVGTNNTFTGGISVKEGKLVLRGYPGKFTWYRWTVRQMRWQEMPSTGSHEMRLEQFGLYDANGDRVNGGLVMPTADRFDPADYSKIASGSIVFGRATKDIGFIGQGDNYGSSLALLCENDWNPTVRKNGIQLRHTSVTSTNEPATWISILMRLDPSCAEVRSYDIAQFVPSSSNYGHAPRSWLLEGSADGRDWFVCDDVDNGPWPKTGSANSRWMYSNTNRDNTSAATHTGGKAIAGATNVVTVAYSGPVSVAAGAVLEAEGAVSIDSLVADPSSSGTIRGVTLAENGTFVLAGKLSSALTLPLVLEDVEGLDNLTNWQVKIGEKVTQYSVVLTDDGKVKILPSGLMLIVR